MTPRRAALRAGCAAALIVAGGCSSRGGSGDYQQYFKLVRDTFANRSGNVTLTEASTVPFASIGYRIGSDNQRMLVLGADNPDGQLWTSASHVVMTTRNGRVVRTVGLGHDMIANGAVSPLVMVRDGGKGQWTADFPDIGRYAVPVSCTARLGRAEFVTILGRKIATRRIDEQCRSGDQAYANTYWVGPTDGLVWRSEQHLSPALKPVQIEILRPPG